MELAAINVRRNPDGTLDLRLQGGVLLSTVRIRESYIVEPEYEDRLASISDFFYGTSNYSDILAQANNIIDPFNVPTGKLLIIPELSNYQELLEIAKQKQKPTSIVRALDEATANAARQGNNNQKKQAKPNVVRSKGRLIYGPGNTKS